MRNVLTINLLFKIQYWVIEKNFFLLPFFMPVLGSV